MESKQPVKLRSSAGPWARAVFKQWGFYVSALLTLVGAIQQVASGFKVPTGVLYGAALVAFVFAQFRAYHSLRVEKVRGDHSAAEREAALLAQLHCETARARGVNFLVIGWCTGVPQRGADGPRRSPGHRPSRRRRPGTARCR
jgi:hypothetical protein